MSTARPFNQIKNLKSVCCWFIYFQYKIVLTFLVKEPLENIKLHVKLLGFTTFNQRAVLRNTTISLNGKDVGDRNRIVREIVA